MNPPTFKPKAYVKDGCPFSFKYWLFLVESGLENRVEVIRCDPEDPTFEAVKSKLAAGLGKAASFPTVEIEPGRYRSDSDALIDWYAHQYNVDINRLPALAFYKETIFPQVLALHESKGRVE